MEKGGREEGETSGGMEGPDFVTIHFIQLHARLCISVV